jgi:hypothetical protein
MKEIAVALLAIGGLTFLALLIVGIRWRRQGIVEWNATMDELRRLRDRCEQLEDERARLRDQIRRLTGDEPRPTLHAAPVAHHPGDGDASADLPTGARSPQTARERRALRRALLQAQRPSQEPATPTTSGDASVDAP